MDSVRTLARLARWLGPWTRETSRPHEVVREAVAVPTRADGDRPFDAWVYRPGSRRAVGSLLVVPGLHYAGPADPRLDRFASILADAGIVVLAPFLPDFSALRVGPGLLPDTERAFETLLALPGRPPGKPGVFSISFGSMPALRLAASERWADGLSGILVFGGYADFGDAVRFSLRGDGARPHDPLNRPVVFMNLVEHLAGVPEDASAVMEAWFEYVRATWGKKEMKERDRWTAVARRIAERLDGAERSLFLLGCGIGEGGFERCAEALVRAGDAFDWLDPRPHLGGLRCPVYLVHGRDDDVIPHTQTALLRRAMPPDVPVRTHLTGMYAHTGHAGLGSLLTLAPAAASELRAMLAILRAITRVASGATPEGCAGLCW